MALSCDLQQFEAQFPGPLKIGIFSVRKTEFCRVFPFLEQKFFFGGLRNGKGTATERSNFGGSVFAELNGKS